MKKLLLFLLMFPPLQQADATEAVSTIANGVTYLCEDQFATVTGFDEAVLDSKIIIPQIVNVDGNNYTVKYIADNLLKNKTFKQIDWDSNILSIGKDAFNNADGYFYVWNCGPTLTGDIDCPFNNFRGHLRIRYKTAEDIYEVLKDCQAPDMFFDTSARFIEPLKKLFEENNKPITFKIDQINRHDILDLKYDFDVLTFRISYRSDIDPGTYIKSIEVDSVTVYKDINGIYRADCLELDQGHVITIAYEGGTEVNRIRENGFSYPDFAVIPFQGKLVIRGNLSEGNPTLPEDTDEYTFGFYRNDIDKYYAGTFESTDSGKILTTEIGDLLPNKSYSSDISFFIEKKSKTLYRSTQNTDSFVTNPIKLYQSYSATQTTLTIKSSDDYAPILDGTFEPDADFSELYFDDKKIETFPYTIENLHGADEYIPVYKVFKKGDQTIRSNTCFSCCRSIHLNQQAIETSPTSITIQASYTKGDANISRFEWEGYDETSDKLVLTGLDPGCITSVKIRAFYDDGYPTDSYIKNYQTSALELKTVKPRNVSATASVFSANTNIDDRESSRIGFQWCESVDQAVNEGKAAIYDGLMEARISDLRPSTEYRVRAFYKSDSGTYYYGGWLTFDMSEFSYTEPTVHTYSIDAVVSDNTAEVRGYIMAGTDDIIRQGFEYSPLASQSAPKRKYVALSQTPSVVFATGQVMTATLTDLQPATTYVIRTFAETKTGIIYGDERIFTTCGVDGVGEITANDSERIAVAYYDLWGRRYDKPQRGVNIIVYDDGSVEKSVIK